MSINHKLAGDFVEVVRTIINFIKQIKAKAHSDSDPVDSDIAACVKCYNQFVGLMKPHINSEESKSRTLWAEFSTAATNAQQTSLKIAKLRATMEKLRMQYISLKSVEEYEAFGKEDTEYMNGETNLFKEMKQMKTTFHVQKDHLEFTGNQLASFIKRWVLVKSQEPLSPSTSSSSNSNSNSNSNPVSSSASASSNKAVPSSSSASPSKNVNFSSLGTSSGVSFVANASKATPNKSFNSNFNASNSPTPSSNAPSSISTSTPYTTIPASALNLDNLPTSSAPRSPRGNNIPSSKGNAAPSFPNYHPPHSASSPSLINRPPATTAGGSPNVVLTKSSSQLIDPSRPESKSEPKQPFESKDIKNQTTNTGHSSQNSEISQRLQQRTNSNENSSSSWSRSQGSPGTPSSPSVPHSAPSRSNTGGNSNSKPKEKDYSRTAQTLKPNVEFGVQRATLRTQDSGRNRSATESEHANVANGTPPPPSSVTTIGAALDAAGKNVPKKGLEEDTFITKDTKEKLSLFILVRPTRKELEDMKILESEGTELPLADPPVNITTTNTNSPKPDIFKERATFKTANAMKNAEYEITKMNFVKHFLKGEQVILLATEIYFRDEMKRSWTKGTLVLTTYRVVFVGDQMITIPLGFVNTCDPVKKKGKKTSSGQKKLEIETKDYRRLHFNFAKNNPCPRSHFASVTKNLLSQPTEKLFAFSWKETFTNNDGWKIFNAEEEYVRMGIKPSNNNGWKITMLNQKYLLCPTYPTVMAVPSRMTDNEIAQVAAYRSKGRIQVLSWIHPTNNATITRCSQPRTGVTRKRSVEDEKMIIEILNANKNNSVLQIFDARPSANARAQQVMGAGTENMSNYPNCVLTFHNIDNIHVMRESLKNLSDAVNSDDDSTFLTNIDNSGWFKHIGKIILAVSKMVDVIHNKKGSILVHCSDGWDRTPQLTGLAMMLLDPYYRTTIGFEVLIEKEFMSFGHQFALRTGHDGANKLSERSPVFLQFMDCVYQLSQQFPYAFQFNETLLRVLVEESFACRFGTFLFDCDRERVKARVKETTPSVWSMINSDLKKYTNVLYKPTKEVLFPSSSMKKIKFWEGYHFKHLPEFLGPQLDEKLSEALEMQN